jgi:2-polyprenyl-3-methyl-5-hydroxy-6-metoxy-1,4-benzoquinol methylase
MTLGASASSRLPSPLVPPLGDNPCLIEMIASVTGESPKDVRNQLACEERDLARQHRQDAQLAGVTPHVWDERLERFYRESRGWLATHVAWNRRPEKLKMREWIGHYLDGEGRSPLRILVMGDGSGFDSLYLSLCGHDVTYCEPCAPCVAFARRLFAMSGRQVRIVPRDTDLAATAAFDTVVCLDVLEHHPDPPAFVKQLAGYLRPGGHLLVSAPFFFVTYHNPTHLRANRKYSGDLARLYTACDLRLVDGRFFWNPLVLQKPTAEGFVSRRSRRWTAALRLSGILLMIGRFWSFPHNRMAVRRFGKADSRWLRDLLADSEQGPGPARTNSSK